MNELKRQDEKKRISWECLSTYRSALMGISILAIIFFHFGEGCRIYDMHYSGFNVWYQQYVGSAGVDGFLFLSGLGLYFSLKKNAGMAEFFKKRFKKILIPYFIIAIPAWFFLDLIHTQSGVTQYFSDLFFVSFFTEGTGWFWYIGMICVCYLIFPYIFRLMDGGADMETCHMRVLTLVSFITVLAVILKLYAPDFFSNVNIALLRFTPFIAGSAAGRAVYEKRKMSYGVFGIIIFSFLLLPLAQNEQVIITRYVRGLFYICVMILLAAAGECFKFRLRGGWVLKILNWFGDYSLELYLSHVMVRKIMNTLGYLTCRIRYEAIMLVCALIVAVILKKLTGLAANVCRKRAVV